MVKIRVFFGLLCMAALAACDLQPKIASIPDSIGEFISSRYPALLADPVKEPEIYNSAAGDYGVYASPELYGSLGATDEYVNYAATDDYVFKDEYMATSPEAQESKSTNEKSADTTDDVMSVPDPESKTAPEDIITVADYQTDELYVAPRAVAGTVVVRRGDTLYAIARDNKTTVADLAAANNLHAPYALRIGQVLKLATPRATKPVEQEQKPEPKPELKPEYKPETKQVRVVTQKSDVRVPVKTVTIARGDTLYSLSRRYAVPVNDLAVMNGLQPPFALSVGGILRVPDLGAESKNMKPVATTKQVAPKTTQPTKATQKQKKKAPTVGDAKQPSAPKQSEKNKVATVKKDVAPAAMPKIAARSSAKFSWPVRGKVLSHFGAKAGGLYNDGINISAAFDSPVRAAENGIVAYAGNEVRGMGNLVIIQHADGWMTVYAHMNSMAVRRGARVTVGQKIGTIGQTGKVNKPQLHFEIRKGTKAYNPTNYLK